MGINQKLKTWIRNWLDNSQPEAKIKEPRLVASEDLDSNHPFRLTIHKAAGGLVIETRTYDRVKDRSNQNLHIVTHDQNLAEALSKVITMESLRG